MNLPQPGRDLPMWARQMVAVLQPFLTRLEQATRSVSSASGVPLGSVVGFVAAPPEGWLACDDSLHGTIARAELYAVIGTTYNHVGDPPGFFRLPNIAGSMIRAS